MDIANEQLHSFIEPDFPCHSQATERYVQLSFEELCKDTSTTDTDANSDAIRSSNILAALA